MMKRPRRSVGVLFAAGLILLAVAGVVVWHTSGEPEGEFALADVLWVFDADGNWHAPGSIRSQHMIKWLSTNTPAILEQKHSQYLVLNERAMQPGSPLGNPLMFEAGPVTKEMIGASNNH